MTWTRILPCGIGGILAVPSWVVLNLPGGHDLLAELDEAAALDELDENAGAVDRLVGEGLDLDRAGSSLADRPPGPERPGDCSEQINRGAHDSNFSGSGDVREQKARSGRPRRLGGGLGGAGSRCGPRLPWWRASRSGSSRRPETKLGQRVTGPGRTGLFEAGARGERGADFLDHVRLLELGLGDRGEEFRAVRAARGRSPPARLIGTRDARRAHHQLQVAAAVLVEHPLDGAVEQRGVRQVGDRAVEPEVDAGDGRVLECA